MSEVASVGSSAEILCADDTQIDTLEQALCRIIPGLKACIRYFVRMRDDPNKK